MLLAQQEQEKQFKEMLKQQEQAIEMEKTQRENELESLKIQKNLEMDQFLQEQLSLVSVVQLKIVFFLNFFLQKQNAIK